MLGFESRPTRASIELGNEFGGGGEEGEHESFFSPNQVCPAGALPACDDDDD
jgi:hypothetical protein